MKIEFLINLSGGYDVRNRLINALQVQWPAHSSPNPQVSRFSFNFQRAAIGRAFLLVNFSIGMSTTFLQDYKLIFHGLHIYP